MKYRQIILLILLLADFGYAPITEATQASATTYDVVIYGGTAAAVTAAVQAKRMGKSVVIVSPDKHLGGLSSGGLGFTDTGDKSVIGGLAREFYHRVWQHYQPARRPGYGRSANSMATRGRELPRSTASNGRCGFSSRTSPSRSLRTWSKRHKIPVHRDEWLDRENGVKKSGARIVAIKTLGGKSYAGRMFIDATYEGDLMAAAGVSYHVGRESNSVYGEKWNGVQTGVLHHRHHFGAVSKKDQPLRRPRRSEERRAAAHQH